MILSSLQTNQLSKAATAWYWSFLRTTSGRETLPMLAFFEPEGSIQVNDRVPAYGRLAIGAELERYWGGAAGVDHEPITILGTDQNFCVEMLARYTLWNDDTITIPAAGFIDRGATGLIQSIRIFADVRPIFK